MAFVGNYCLDRDNSSKLIYNNHELNIKMFITTIIYVLNKTGHHYIYNLPQLSFQRTNPCFLDCVVDYL